MKILVVDDEALAVESLVKVLEQELPDAEIVTFIEPEGAFAYLAAHVVDIAFLDIEMGHLSGLALAKRCKDLCPTVNIIFVTGYSQYTMDALRLHVSGYLMKPVRAEDLRTELSNLRHPMPTDKRVRIQTFGNFEVFVDGKALRVPRQKCKECLAYLVDRRGAGVTYAQLSTVLWEERPLDRTVQKSTQKIISILWKALEQAGVEDILIRTRMEIAIDAEKVDCDYFRAIAGDTAWLNSFTGEYMSNYSWAEVTLGELIEIKSRTASHKKTVARR